MGKQSAEILRKTAAIAVAASLLITTPGVAAVAGEIAAVRVAPVVPVGPSGSTAAGLLRAPLTLQGITPTLSAPTLTVTPLARPVPAAAAGVSLAVPAAQPAAAALPSIQGRVAAPLAAQKDAPGLIGVISHQLRGENSSQAPEAAGWLKAPAADATPAASKGWADTAFSVMRGERAPAAAADAVAGSEIAPRQLLARPSLTANRAFGDAPPSPTAAKVQKAVKIIMPLVAIGVAVAAYTGVITLPFGLGAVMHGFSASWPTLIAANIGIAVAMQVGKKWWAKRKENKAKAAEKSALKASAVNRSPVSLAPEAAAEAVAKRVGTNQGVSIYDYSTGMMHEVPVAENLVERVKAGDFKVTTDNTGALFLVPDLIKQQKPLNAVAEEAKPVEPAPAQVEKPAEPAAVAPAPAAAAPAPVVAAAPAPKAAKTPKSFSSLPADAKALDAAALAKGKAAAQARARRQAPDARLVRVTINLDDPRAHPVYVFHSRKKGKILTVWQKRIGVKSDRGSPLKTSDTLWDTRLAKVQGMEQAYTALKAQAHWFKPTRVELAPRWKGDPTFVFMDAKGREQRVSAAAAEAPSPTPAPPPAEAPAPQAPPEQPPAPPVPDKPVERGPPPEAPPPPAAPNPGEGQKAELPKPAGPHLSEDLLGFRAVRGVRRDPTLFPIRARATVPEVIDHIARQFGFTRDQVLAMGLRFNLRENSERAAWLAVYDRLQAGNRAEYEHLDQKKYQDGLLTETLTAALAAVGLRKKAVEGSFRKLANKTYRAGWKGRLVRALELHKVVVGILVRLPYHLFDSFLFGYFRRAAAYEFFRGSEDFFAVRQALDIERAKERGTFTRDMLEGPSLAERWLESAMQQQYAGGPTTAWQRFKARPAVRTLTRWVVTPVLAPLVKFTWRRATLAIFSAAAMGFVAGVVPLPLLGFHLTALPFAGAGLAWLSHGLPPALAHVPFVGEALSGILGHAFKALIDDMTVGNILNTFVLSTALTYPNAVRQRLMDDRGQGQLTTARLRSRAFWYGVVGTFFSARFWLDNLKSFIGLATVGAEIEGIMAYTGSMDAALSPAYHAATGHDFTLFHTMAAAVERPQGQSPIPFGGAITWGNVLIYKFQNLLGFNLTDSTYRFTHGLFYAESTDTVSKAVLAQHAAPAPAAGVPAPELGDVPAGAGGGAPGGVSVVAGILGAVGKAGAAAPSAPRTPGDISAEMARVREAISGLEGRIASRQARVDELAKQSKPVSEADEAAYQETLRLLAQKTDQSYVQGKLAEIHDLKNPKDGEGALKTLGELADYYRTLLPEQAQSTGYLESTGVRLALVKTVQQAYADFQAGRGLAPAARPVSPVDREATARLEPMVAELERLRGEAKTELANHDALERLLATVAKARDMALQDRRSGKEMLEFHKNMARLATVMDLAFSLNTIAAAQRAILDVQKMLDDKLAKIKAASDQAAKDKAINDANKAKMDQYKKEIDDKVAGDRSSQSDMTDLESYTRSAVTNIAGFRTDLNRVLAQLNGADSGSSPNALAEYNRRLALLPTIVDWNLNGKPGDPDYVSVKSLRQKLADADADLAKVNDGLARLDNAPVEFAGVLIVAVPGTPEVHVVNPSAATTLQVLADRKAYWQGQLAHYQREVADFRHRLDPNFGGTETDEFGDVHPYSLPKRLAEAQTALTNRSAEARDLAARIDAAAAEVRAAAPGADLPALTGLDLAAYQTAIEGYADKLKAVVIGAKETKENQNGRIALLKVGRLLPAAGHAVVEWSKADATITAVSEAMTSPLPQALAVHEGIVAGVQAILADVDADVAFVNGGQHTLSENQGLIDRKRALMNQLRPMLANTKDMLLNQAIPFAEKNARSYAPDGDKWAKLFKAQVKVYEGTRDAVTKSLPWALASNGARDGDTGTALTNIEARRQKFRDLMTGYDDERGHHKGVEENLAEIAKRKDPNNTETEDVYGQQLPVSLPRLITQFTAEKASRAGEINAQDGQINDILDRIDRLTGGRYSLASRKLPTGIGTDAGSVARVQGLVDARAFQNLGDLLTQIGADAKAKAGSVSVGAGGGSSVPSGTQPTPTVDDYTQTALLALEAAKRLVPSTADQSGAPAAYAVARFLYSDAAVAAAHENLDVKIPIALVFLGHAKTALTDAISDLDKDVAYVQANGGGEAGDSVIDRKVRVYSALNAVTREGMDFYGLKVTWDQDSYNTLNRMGTYYGSTGDIYNNAATVDANEVAAIQKMKDALQKTFDDLEVQRQKLNRWMSQLNSPDESALKRVGENLREVQEKTRAVLEQNVQYHDMEDRFKRSDENLTWTLGRIDKVQGRLSSELRALRDPAVLDPALRQRIEALRFEGSSWYMGGDTGDATAALVVPKKDFSQFVDTVFSALLTRASSARDLSGLKRQLLENPSSLSDVIGNSKVVEFGGADGFYMVYQSQFSVPHGLETSNWVTLGNVAKLWGNNVSVTGYQFASPPNAENAPWGDKGIEVQVESLQGRNWVNYLNIDFHRFIQDIPPDTRMASTANQSRVMLFEDFAVLLFGDRLYVAFTGFADGAAKDTTNKPYFYGGSFKTSLKFTEVMRLNAEQQQVFAKDPRYFLENLNMDFTGLDPDLNHNFPIYSHGENKHYTRTQIGPSFDLAKLMDSQDAFTVDLFWARQSGTDDYNQDSMGISVLKGFTIRSADGKPWMVISNRAGAEVGTKANTYSDRATVTLPDWGVAVSAEGRLIGDAKTYYLQASKKLGDYSDVSVGYGTRYPGIPNRLTLALNSSFTLGQLWGAVAAGTAEELQGGKTLKDFDATLDGFYKENEKDPRVTELKAVFQRDIASRLVRQDIGRLATQLKELRSAGALMDNTRVRGMVGFTSNPIGEAISDRAVGGGFTAGTQTTLTLDKTQKALVEERVHEIYAESMRLQFRMMELTKDWQETLVEVAEAQWELKMAKAEAAGAPDEALRRDGDARVAAAELRLRQAATRYNAMVGRPETEDLPFKDLSAAQLDAVLAQIKDIMAAQDPLVEILKGLSPAEIHAAIGGEPFNLMDWIPWVDHLTFSVGAQFSDMMANQVLGIGGSIRLPFYDPGSKEKDRAYRLQTQASMSSMLETWESYGLAAERERAQARGYDAGAELLKSRAAQSAAALDAAIKGYRNGLVTESRLREAYDQWRFYQGGTLTASARATLTQGWSTLDAAFARPRPDARTPSTVNTFQQAFDQAARAARGLDELEARREAAEHMGLANASRIQKFYADIFLGYNITASGVGLLPSFGITGIAVTPVLTFELKTTELRDLQLRQGASEEAYYRGAKTKLEADLALEFYRQTVAWHQAGKAADLLKAELLPELSAALERARALPDPAAREAAVAKAQKDLDNGQRRLQLAVQGREEARAAINHLLGRAPDAALDLGLTPEKALDDLRTILSAKNPVAADQAVLDARVETARAVQVMADKNLKIKQLRLEPVSLVVSSLGRLIGALSDAGIGNPDVVAAASIQRLQAERARQAYDEDLPVRQAALRAQLAAAESSLRDARGRGDVSSRMAAVDLEAQVLALQGGLARLGADAAPRTSGKVPASFAALSDRVTAAEQDLAYSGKSADVSLFEPETESGRSEMNVRYFRANTSLGGDRIDKDFIESWITVRLRSQDTPENVLLALAQLRLDKASREHRNTAAAGRARGQMLVSEFETTVRVKRWLDAQGTAPASLGARKDLNDFRRAVSDRLAGQAARIKALLGLPAATSADELARLVPGDAEGKTGDLAALARGMLDDVRKLQVERLREAVFDGGIPDSFGNEDSLIHQIRADVIAERMSYKGFTPVAAFGMFRGKSVWGGFLEAPDPRSIEAGLQRVLSDSVRKELESQGRMRDLTLRLNLLMNGVAGNAKLAERQAVSVAAAQDAYRAAAARVDAGLAGQEELFAAQDALVHAWLELSDTLAALKSDHIALVTELEALGFDHKKLLGAAALPAATEPEPGQTPASMLADYASRRSRDAGFAKEFEGALAALPGAGPEAAKTYAEAAAAYRQLAQDADDVRHNPNFTSEERLKLLTTADVEGRRQAAEAVVARILAGLQDDAQARAAVLAVLGKDLERQTADASGLDSRERAFAGELRQAMLNDAPIPLAVRGEVDRLEGLHTKMLEARQALREEAMRDRRTPTQFLLSDAALDRALKAETAYDEGVVALYARPEVKNDPDLARLLDGPLPVRESLARQLDLARQGRGMLALDALIGLAQDRLAALRFDRALPAEVDAALGALQRLTDLRQAWRAKDPKGLAPLVVLTKPDAQGRRTWTAEDWLTEADLQSVYAGRITTDAAGRRWVVGRDGTRYEVVSGVDAAEARLIAARGANDANEARRRLYTTLKDSEFALVALDGGAVTGLSYADLTAKARAGQVFTFAIEPDARGLRPAAHPLKALWDGPAAVETIVYVGTQHLARDRFPTYESLREYTDALARAGDPAAKDFLRLEAGPSGLVRLMEAAKELRARSERAGWIGVKLQSYGFAVDAQNRPRELYLTQEEFDAAVKDVNNAARLLSEAEGKLDQAKALEAAARQESEAHKPQTAAESAAFQLADREARARLKDKVTSDTPRKAGEGDGTYALRLKAAIDLAVAKDSKVKAAQDRMAVQVEAQNKLDTKLHDLERASDKAVDALRAAARLAAHAGQWAAVRAGVEASFKASGLKDDDIKRELDELDAEGARRLFIARDAALKIDSQNNLVGVSASPVFGSEPLDARIGTPDGAVRSVAGELFAATMDLDGRLVKLYYGPDEVAAAGRTWRLVGIDGSETPVASQKVNPALRLVHYADPATVLHDPQGREVPGSALPVLLNRRYMISLLTDSGREKTRVETWAYGPWNWGNILWEIPKGVLGSPLELLTGRDMNQNGFVGRANMNKIDGGSTEHHGFFRKVLDTVDILDIMPDPVDWYFDPSQFPAEVALNSPLLPGQNLSSKVMRAGDRDIHYGRTSLGRTIDNQVQDILSGNRRVLGHFSGGVEQTWLEERRGRQPGRTYLTSKVTGEVGGQAVDDALRDETIGGDDRSLHPEDGPVSLSGRPGHVEVDRVERRVDVTPGALQYGRVTDHLAGLPEVVAGRAKAAEANAPGLASAVSAGDTDTRARLGELDQARREEAELLARAHEQGWRIGAQHALERELARLKTEIAQLRAELARQRQRLKELEDELRRLPQPGNPGGPTNPNDPSNPGARLPWWAWVGGALAAAALLALVWELLRRRRPLTLPA